MNAALEIKLVPAATPEGEPMASSQEVAKAFGKRHDNVIQSIKRLLADRHSKGLGLLTFKESTYLNLQGKSQPEYLMDKDAFMLLAMRFTGAKAAVVQDAFLRAFNALKEENRKLRIGAPSPDVRELSKIIGQFMTHQAETNVKLATALTLMANNVFTKSSHHAIPQENQEVSLPKIGGSSSSQQGRLNFKPSEYLNLQGSSGDDRLSSVQVQELWSKMGVKLRSHEFPNALSRNKERGKMMKALKTLLPQNMVHTLTWKDLAQSQYPDAVQIVDSWTFQKGEGK
jgi:Rha family phage regulatory protein